MKQISLCLAAILFLSATVLAGPKDDAKLDYRITNTCDHWGNEVFICNKGERVVKAVVKVTRIHGGDVTEEYKKFLVEPGEAISLGCSYIRANVQGFDTYYKFEITGAYYPD